MKYGKMTMERYRAEGYTGKGGRYLRCFLDGKEVHNCKEFDDVAGYVIVFKTDMSGKLFVNTDGKIQEETLYGAVQAEEGTN